MTKRFQRSLIALAAAAFLAACTPARTATVAVVKSRALPAYDAAQQGFMTVVGGQLRPTCYALTGDPAVTRRVMSQIKSSPPDLVLALGTEAADQVKSALGRMPAVFAMVVDPVQSGLVSSLSRPGGNMTGVTLAIPPSQTLEVIRRAVPGVRRVGIIYDPAQSQRAVREMTDAARPLGLQVIARSVRSASEVPRAAEDLRGSIDCLCAPVDGTVYSPQSAKFLLLFALRNGIPVAGFSANLVEAGALLALYPDYADVGRQAGYLALRVLAGEPPGSVPVAAPRKALLAINLSVERTLGLSIPQAVRKTADRIFR
jgi:putative ABC transport system substrate-binding protein